MPNGKLKKILKTTVISLGAVVVMLIVMELFFRLTEIIWLPVYQKFFDQPDKIYVYALGESTSEGVQYQTKISPAILVREQFNQRIGNKNIEIISLAASGQTAEYMYFKFYFELLFKPHQNGLVLIYSGINEGIENMSYYDFRYWHWIQKSIVLSKIAYMANVFDNNAQRYEARLHQTCAMSKKHKYKVVLSQLVGNVKDFDPDVPADDMLLREENMEIFSEADSFFNQKEYKQAETKYEALNIQMNGHLHTLYRIAQCKYQHGMYDSTRLILQYLTDANNYLGFSGWKNNILERVAASEHVTVAKVYDRFCDSSEHRLPGYELINDAHHPNLRGYCIMADAISAEVSALYNEPKPPSLIPDSVAADFNFTPAFYTDVYYKLIEWYIFNLFNTEVRDLRIARLRFYLNKYETLNPNDEILILWNLIISVLEKDESLFVQHLRHLNTCQRKGELLERFETAFRGKIFARQIKQIIELWKLENDRDRKLKAELLSALGF